MSLISTNLRELFCSHSNNRSTTVLKAIMEKTKFLRLFLIDKESNVKPFRN